MKKPKLAIFDLGNVVFNIDWEPMYTAWSVHSGVPVETLKQRVKADEQLELFERNEISAADFHQHVNTMLGVGLTYGQFQEGWNAIFKEANDCVCGLLPKLKNFMQLVAYTNTNEIHAPVWLERYADPLQHFDDIFISSRIGFRKPELNGFLHVLDRRGVAASDAVFFDDLPDNITGAERAGISAVLVDTPDSIRQALRQMGIEVS